MRYNFSSHHDYIRTHICTHAHTQIYTVLSHRCMCTCVYIVIFQIYLSVVMIELEVVEYKFEFSQRSFLSFSKATNRKKISIHQNHNKVKEFFCYSLVDNQKFTHLFSQKEPQKHKS